VIQHKKILINYVRGLFPLPPSLFHKFYDYKVRYENECFHIPLLPSTSTYSNPDISEKLKENNYDQNEYEDIRHLIDLPKPEFYWFIAENVCNKESTSSLNKFLGLQCGDIGAKALFAEARESYEMLGLDGTDLLDYYLI
jgi:hypothetical protein